MRKELERGRGGEGVSAREEIPSWESLPRRSGGLGWFFGPKTKDLRKKV